MFYLKMICALKQCVWIQTVATAGRADPSSFICYGKCVGFFFLSDQISLHIFNNVKLYLYNEV